MQWRSMKTAPMDGRCVWVTIQSIDGCRGLVRDRYPYFTGAIAWAHDVEPELYTGTIEELDMEDES